MLQRYRQEASEYKGDYGHDISVDILSQRAADIAQLYTQKAFMRPYAVETIMASIDLEKGPMLYKVDPAGHFYGYRVIKQYYLTPLGRKFRSQRTRSRRLPRKTNEKKSYCLHHLEFWRDN